MTAYKFKIRIKGKSVFTNNVYWFSVQSVATFFFSDIYPYHFGKFDLSEFVNRNIISNRVE